MSRKTANSRRATSPLTMTVWDALILMAKRDIDSDIGTTAAVQIFRPDLIPL